MATNMGLGVLGTGDSVFKRKFRWTMQFIGVCGIGGNNIGAAYVKSANRPNLTIDEVEINYLNGKMWIPGKGTPDTTTVTYYDVASQEGSEAISQLFSWLGTVYNFTDSIRLTQSSAQNVAGGYTADAGILKMLDGCGEVIDGFIYLNPWPTSINFGELDYATNDECTVEVTLRYRNFEYFTSNGRCSNTFDVYCAGCGDSFETLNGASSLTEAAKRNQFGL
jgi:hypothetical protein